MGAKVKLLALAFCAGLLSACALPGILAVGGAALETGTADDNPEASGGLVSRQFKAACQAIDGKYDPMTGDCERNLFQ